MKTHLRIEQPSPRQIGSKRLGAMYDRILLIREGEDPIDLTDLGVSGYETIHKAGEVRRLRIEILSFEVAEFATDDEITPSTPELATV